MGYRAEVTFGSAGRKRMAIVLTDDGPPWDVRATADGIVLACQPVQLTKRPGEPADVAEFCLHMPRTLAAKLAELAKPGGR